MIKRAVVGDSGVLIYETDDSEFADSVVDALTQARIHCYRTGGALLGGSSFTICIYILNGGDMQRANEILVKLGASVDPPSKVSQKFILLTVFIGALGASRLIDVYGVWPSFEDAEIVSVALDRGNHQEIIVAGHWAARVPPSLIAKVIVFDTRYGDIQKGKYRLVTLRFVGVSLLIPTRTRFIDES